MSSSLRERKKKKQIAIEPPPSISWQQKKDLADLEASVLEKEIQDLRKWTEMIEAMNDEQLREYLKNRPQELKTVRTPKPNPKQRGQQARKSKSSSSTGIMASVWKFHKEDVV